MNCQEFKEHVDAWVLDMADPADADACVAHLASKEPHDGCEAAVARARETLLGLAQTLPPQNPGPRVWEAIESATKAAETPAAGRVSRPRRDWVVWAVAAVALIVSGAALALYSRERQSHLADNRVAERTKAAYKAALAASQQREKSASDAKTSCLRDVASLRGDVKEAVAVLAILDDPATRVVPFDPHEGSPAHATALLGAGSSRALIVSTGLVAKPGSDYELWVVRGDGPPKPAGFLRPRADGTAIAEVDRKLLAEGAPDALAVSVEPAGGRPAPTGAIILTAKLQS